MSSGRVSTLYVISKHENPFTHFGDVLFFKGAAVMAKTMILVMPKKPEQTNQQERVGSFGKLNYLPALCACVWRVFMVAGMCVFCTWDLATGANESPVSSCKSSCC